MEKWNVSRVLAETLEKQGYPPIRLGKTKAPETTYVSVSWVRKKLEAYGGTCPYCGRKMTVVFDGLVKHLIEG